jgi:large subunit ribosomal protein L18
MNVEEAIADFGMQISTKGNRLYAAIKGLVDAGLKVPHDPVMLPDAKRLCGEHIAVWSPKAGKPAFAAYKVRPADLPKHFAEVKSKIIGGKA